MALGSIILKKFSRTTWLGPTSFMIAGITLILIPFFGFAGAMVLFFISGVGRAIFEADRSGILGALVAKDNAVKTSLFSLDKVLSSFFVAITYIFIWQVGLLNHSFVVWILSGVLLIPAAIITFMVESRVRKCIY
jgi:esterase/lipase superfamily enzyme